MTQYCSSCRGTLNSPIEMAPREGFFTTTYQCPCCMATREVDLSGIAKPSQSGDKLSADTQNGSSALRRVGKFVLAGTLLAIALGPKNK